MFLRNLAFISQLLTIASPNWLTGYHPLSYFMTFKSPVFLIAGTTPTPTKTSLENISSLYLHYLVIFPIRTTCTMWPNYPVTEQVGTTFKLRQKMKNLSLFAHVHKKNLEFGHFTLLFGRVQRRNVPKFITQVQGL